jgi:hypothetical protein
MVNESSNRALDAPGVRGHDSTCARRGSRNTAVALARQTALRERFVRSGSGLAGLLRYLDRGPRFGRDLGCLNEFERLINLAVHVHDPPNRERICCVRTFAPRLRAYCGFTPNARISNAAFIVPCSTR